MHKWLNGLFDVTWQRIVARWKWRRCSTTTQISSRSSCWSATLIPPISRIYFRSDNCLARATPGDGRRQCRTSRTPGWQRRGLVVRLRPWRHGRLQRHQFHHLCRQPQQHHLTSRTARMTLLWRRLMTFTSSPRQMTSSGCRITTSITSQWQTRYSHPYTCLSVLYNNSNNTSNKCLTWDVTAACTVADSNFQVSSREPGAVAELSANRKEAKYSMLTSSHIFQPNSPNSKQETHHRRWDSERELSLWHRTRTTNMMNSRLLHKFRHRSPRFYVGTREGCFVHQIKCQETRFHRL